MPRTRSLAWSELKIGIITVVALALAIMLIVAVGGQGGFTWDRYTLKTKFTNVAGLKSGSPVRIAGVEVGSVDDVDVTGTEVDVIFQVNVAAGTVQPFFPDFGVKGSALGQCLKD